MNKLKNQNGITLIALVITIIVMLILVAVTITMAVNGGLFDYARKAGQATNEAIKQEQQLANLDANLTVDQLIEKYSGITASTVKSDPTRFYGATVTNYEWPNKENEDITWRIFHSDGENIYLIASDYVANAPDGIKGSEIYVNDDYCLSMDYVEDDYELDEYGYIIGTNNPARKWIEHYLDSGYVNMRAVAYMLDTVQWGELYKGEDAKYAIGAPTLKMFADSYNLTHTNKISYIQSEENPDYGYNVKVGTGEYKSTIEGIENDDLYIITKNPSNDENGRAYATWLASPSSEEDRTVFTMVDVTNESDGGYDSGSYGFRPIVCLNSNVALEAVTEGENTTYKIK